MSNSPDPVRDAVNILKGKENPFASLARPQRLDNYFLDLHVPELLARERDELLQIIDHYRVDEYSRAGDLRATRVVMILGDRGAGKTHLLQSLSYRRDGKSQLLIRPSFFDANLPVEEYLLTQLVSTLLAEDEGFGTRPIDDLAAALVRRLLRQTLRSLGPTDRIFALSPDRWRRWRLLLGGGDRASRVFEDLAELLEKPPSSGDLRQLLRGRGIEPEQCYRLLCGHLRRFEMKQDLRPDLQSALRCEVYRSMASAVLLGDSDRLFLLLEGEYAGSGGDAGARAEVVARMLHILIEACALVRQPIVVAFDNLERVFSPQNRFDDKLIRAFWNCLAQAIDNTRGLLLLLFAERGLFEQSTSLMDSFARDRIDQGVPLFGRGPVSRIDLFSPAAEDIKTVIATRVERVLGDFADKNQLPDGFPFTPDFLRKEAATSQSLRNSLFRLRDEYSRRIYEQEPARGPEITAAANWENLLESSWKDQMLAQSRKEPGPLAVQRIVIHAGLNSLLERAVPLQRDGWKLAENPQTVPIGDSPYGRASLLSWQHQAAGMENGAEMKLGVGLLLAQGTGMPPDLRAKFDFFRAPAKGDHLVILWPTPRDGDDVVELLPPTTRSVWDGSRHRKKTSLRKIEENDLRVLVCFPAWLNSLETLAEQPVPPEVLREFVARNFGPILHLVVPPTLREERTVADED